MILFFSPVLQPTSGAPYSEDDFVIMTTTEKEKYKCLLPSLANGEEVSNTLFGSTSGSKTFIFLYLMILRNASLLQ